MLLFSFIEMCSMLYDIAHDCYPTIIHQLHDIIYMYVVYTYLIYSNKYQTFLNPKKGINQ